MYIYEINMDYKHPKMSIGGERESWEPKGDVGRGLQLLMSWRRKWIARYEERKFLKSSSTWIFWASCSSSPARMALAPGNGTHGNMQLGIWQLGSLTAWLLATGTWQYYSWHQATWRYWHIIESGRIQTSLALAGHGLGSGNSWVEYC